MKSAEAVQSKEWHSAGIHEAQSAIELHDSFEQSW